MNLEDLIDVDELKEDVVERAAQILLDSIKYDAKQSVLQSVKGCIGDHINQIVIEALSESYQPIDTYGEPTGPMTTLREQFKKAVVNWWNETVDDDGKPGGRWNSEPRYKWVASKVIGDVLGHKLKKEFKALVDQSRELIKKGIAELVAEKITQVWGK
jgi:hypothetical protein